MNHDRYAFNRGAIRPMQCLADGWRLIKEEYWFFLGVTFVGYVISELAPLFLMGPAFCGIHICLLRRANGQRVTFDMLFQGFNYFAPSLLASFIMMLPVIVIALIYYAALVAGGVGAAIWASQQQQAGGRPEELVFWIILGWFALTTLGLIVAITAIQALFLFVFPLIIDRELSGWQSVTTGIRAAFANLGGVVTIAFFELLLAAVGLATCGIGAVFIMPLSFAVTAVAYRQVFPVIDLYEDFVPDAEPPAPIVVSKDTNVQSLEP